MSDEKDLKEILKGTIEKKSDFSFEMKILEYIQKSKFDCEHSGTYLDPYTKINREFDIRAYKNFENNRHLWLAVECKNVSPDFPLIIHSTKMDRSEKIHTLMINHSGFKGRKEEFQPNRFSGFAAPVSQDLNIFSKIYAYQRSFSYYVKYQIKNGGCVFPSLYSDFDYVGRSMDKLKIKGQGKNLEYILNDSEIYDKFSQCQNSLVDLIEEAAWSEFDDGIHQFALIPVLVVPDGTIWEQRYHPNGTKAEEVKMVDRIPFYVDKYFKKELCEGTPSHLIRFTEIVSEQGLIDLLSILKGEEDNNLPTFLLDKDAEELVATERDG